ncbi:hypothetical protein C0J52_18144 [Blattella germanica]|nr:hypothetical protein C0J52_18144 [Blattella germanica]
MYKSLKELTEKAIDVVSEEDWIGFCKKVEEEENRYWKNDGIVSNIIFIFNRETVRQLMVWRLKRTDGIINELKHAITVEIANNDGITVQQAIISFRECMATDREDQSTGGCFVLPVPGSIAIAMNSSAISLSSPVYVRATSSSVTGLGSAVDGVLLFLFFVL